jgi:predicted DNA-binding mobile mystery protein A
MKDQARQALERVLAPRRSQPTPRPPRGWVRAIREALGMSARELAARLGVSQQAVSRLEAAEPEGAMTLDKLEEVARALGCRLEYALVPDRPLDEMVRDQARQKARALLDPVGHSMAMEGQDVDLTEEVERLAAELADKRGLWSAP